MVRLFLQEIFIPSEAKTANFATDTISKRIFEGIGKCGFPEWPFSSNLVNGKASYLRKLLPFWENCVGMAINLKLCSRKKGHFSGLIKCHCSLANFMTFSNTLNPIKGVKWTGNQLMDMPKRTKLSLLKQTTEGIGDVLFSHKLSFVWCFVCLDFHSSVPKLRLV